MVDKRLLIDTFKSIKSLFQESRFFINKNLDQHQAISKCKQIDVFTASINSIVQSSLNKFKLEEILETIIHLEKEAIKSLNEVALPDLKESREVKQGIQLYILKKKKVIRNFVDYKKLQLISHYLAGLQYILTSFDFSNIMAMIKEEILDEEQDIFSKIYIMEKVYESMRYIEEVVSIRIHKLETNVGNTTKLKLKDLNIEEDGFAYKFIYKYMVTSLTTLKTLWALRASSNQSYFIHKEKVNQLLKIKSTYIYLYGVHQYINTLNITEPLSTYFKESQNDGKPEEDEEKKEKIIKFLTEIELVSNKLVQLLNSRKDNRISSDHFSAEMVVMYASSLLDNLYLKKIALIIAYSVLNGKRLQIED